MKRKRIEDGAIPSTITKLHLIYTHKKTIKNTHTHLQVVGIFPQCPHHLTYEGKIMTFYCKICKQIVREKAGYLIKGDDFYCEDHIMQGIFDKDQLDLISICLKFALDDGLFTEKQPEYRKINSLIPVFKQIEEAQKVLELDLDDLFQGAYFYTDYDIGGRGHYINIRAENKEKFLDAMSKEFRKRVEESLEECEDWED